MLAKLSLLTRNMSYRRSSGSCGIVTSDIRLKSKIEGFCVCLVSPIRVLVLTFNVVFVESFVSFFPRILVFSDKMNWYKALNILSVQV
jgi:hypothetical protein